MGSINHAKTFREIEYNNLIDSSTINMKLLFLLIIF